MAEQLFGIEKSKEALTTVLQTIETVSENLKDGVQITDLLALLPLVPGINEMIKDIPDIKNELGELSTEDLNGLLAHFKLKFNLGNEDLAAFIEDAVQYVVDSIAHGKRGIELVQRFKDLKAPAPDAPIEG